MLNPTDCVKDRLAKFYAWGDSQALYQALIVAAAQPISLREVRRWSVESEREKGMYELFRKLLEKVRNNWNFTEDDIIQEATDWKVAQRIKKYGY